MRGKASRTLLWAVAVSLATHLLLFGTSGQRWFRPVAELAFPIEATLSVPLPEPAPAMAEPRPPGQPLAQSVPIPADAAVAGESLQEPSAPIELPTVPLPVSEPVAVAEPVSVPSRSSPVPVSAPEPPLRAALRQLPDSLLIRYGVQAGDGDAGFVAGRATYIWRVQKGRYSLVSTVEATGLASLFVSGRIVQVSEGTVAENGLRPAQYWLQRKERKQDTARFDWDLGRLILEGRESQPLTPQAQDLLSFPFHLAMTARAGEPDFRLGVTNGRKFGEYGFRSLGRVSLEMQERRFDALHLQGTREGEGVLDVWLDLDRSGLPVRIRTLDRKGKVMELRLEAVEQTALGSGSQP